MKKLIKLAAIAFTATSIAHAAPGAYIQAQGGIGGMDTKKVSNWNYNLREGLAYRLSAGYLFGESNFNYGLEAGYESYPNNTYDLSILNAKYSGSNVDVLGVAKYSFSPDATGFYVVGKAGAAYITQKTELSIANVNVYNDTESAIKPEAAIGVGYDFTKNLGLDVSYSHIFAGQANPDGATENSVTQISSVNTLMVGLSYHF